MAVDFEVFLNHRQGRTRRDSKLPFHQVVAGDRLGYRVLHLQAGVHLHEPETIGFQPVRTIDDELNSTRTGIPDRLGSPHGSSTHGVANIPGHAGRGRFLDDLLVAALQRAIAFEQVNRTFTIAKDLNLDMARLRDVFLDQAMVVAERSLRLALGAGEPGFKAFGRLDLAHPLATATCAGLDQDWVANLLRLAARNAGSWFSP